MPRPFTIAMILCLAAAGPAFAQGETVPAIVESPIDAPDPKPRPPADESDAARLDRLFSELETVEREDEAAFIAEEIEAIWSGAESPTAELLVDRSTLAVKSGEVELARRLADAALKVAPGSVVAWSHSALLAFDEGDTAKSVADLQRALEIEPRHYPSLLGLGTILEKLERWDGAYEAYERALALHPHLEEAEARRADIERRARGRDL